MVSKTKTPPFTLRIIGGLQIYSNSDGSSNKKHVLTIYSLDRDFSDICIFPSQGALPLIFMVLKQYDLAINPTLLLGSTLLTLEVFTQYYKHLLPTQVALLLLNKFNNINY